MEFSLTEVLVASALTAVLATTVGVSVSATADFASTVDVKSDLTAELSTSHIYMTMPNTPDAWYFARGCEASAVSAVLADFPEQVEFVPAVAVDAVVVEVERSPDADTGTHTLTPAVAPYHSAYTGEGCLVVAGVRAGYEADGSLREHGLRISITEGGRSASYSYGLSSLDDHSEII